MKVFVLALLLAAGVVSSTHVRAADDPNKEADALYEQMRDVAAVVKAGTSYVDFTGRLPPLAIGLDRIQRHGGQAGGDLSDALKAFKQAAGYWSQALGAATPGIGKANMALVDTSVQLANISLDHYEHQRDDRVAAEAAAASEAAASAAAAKSHKQKKVAAKKLPQGAN